MDVGLEEAERRDPKGLYARARKGEIAEFTGVSAPYEVPVGAEVHVRTEEVGVEGAVRQIVGYLNEKGLLARVEETTAE